MYYDRDGYPVRPSNTPAWAMFVVMVLAVAAFIAFLYPDIARMPGLPERAKQGAVGGQAPVDDVSRGGGAIATPAAVQQSIDAYNAAEQQRAAQLEQVPTAVPLPLNSAGGPIIDAAQQAQQAQSLQMAEQEGAAAADAQLAAQRATANAAALSRAPDVSKQDAEAEMHRSLCSVPRANPATCAQGLYKPTPVN